jgi:di/tricarboxylate transporter
VLIAVFAMLMLDLLSADAVLLGGLVVVVIGGVILATAILTNIATNNGAVALMFSIALSMAKGQKLTPRALMGASRPSATRRTS